MIVPLDQIDRKMLEILQENARTPNSEIAERLGMAPSATFERHRKLERKGVIKSYETRLDPGKINLPLVAFVFVRTNEGAGEAIVAPKLISIPHVLEVYNVAGEDCYLVKVRASDTTMLGRLIREEIGQIHGVTSTRTTIVMEAYKETGILPLDQADDTVKGK
jgi:Lrp/AsnC family leucine-responsive transcriptional regulator